jgi:hypothetical protein
MNPIIPNKNNACPDLACKLTTPELALRKATVLASLKKELVESKELGSGYSYKFNGDDRMIDQLCEFIKTERQCCDFFTFTLTIQKETSFVFLEITGPQGTKEFIKTELEL